MSTKARALGSAVSVGGVIQRDGAVKTYNTVNDLPASDLSGSFAFVISTQSLYMWNGAEWDRVYLGSNMLLEWTTEPNSLYNLDIFGNPTTITTAAIDPEGFPILYSYDTNPSNQVQALIANNSDGTFTLTPSINDSDAGNFTLRIKASDGLHVTSRSSTVSLQFISLLSLSGGTGGGPGSTLYTAPNGTLVSVSDLVYGNAIYNIGYMFNNTPSGVYYLGNGQSTGNITFNFSTAPVSYLGHMIVYPWTRSDTFSNITSIQRSSDGTNWTTLYGDQGLNITNTPIGTSYRYDLNTTDKYIRFNLQRQGNWGLSMNEIEVYAAP